VPFTGPCCGNAFAQGIAMDPTDPSTLYLCVNGFEIDATGSGLYKTTDGGSTWARIGRLTTPLFQGASTMMDQPLRIRVDPKNPKHLYCGDGVRGSAGGFWVSNDGGETFAQPDGWRSLSASENMGGINDVYDIAVDSADFNHVLVSLHSPFSWNGGCGSRCGNAGILESKDGGTTWIIHEPMNWGYGHSVWFLNNSTTWLLGTQGNGFWRTTNSGATWTQVTTENIAHGGGQIYYSKTGVLYASCGGTILRSTDNGEHFTGVGQTQFTTAIFGDGNYLYAHKAYGGVNEAFSVSLEDDGVTWTTLPGAGSFSNGPFEMVYDKDNHLLYAGNWGDGIIAMKVTDLSISVNGTNNRSVPEAASGRRLVSITGSVIKLSHREAATINTVNLFTIKGELMGTAPVNKDGTVRIDRSKFGRLAILAEVCK
jgi:photosystem II stability/assembly factor-like uncharacterized protein